MMAKPGMMVRRQSPYVQKKGLKVFASLKRLTSYFRSTGIRPRGSTDPWSACHVSNCVTSNSLIALVVSLLSACSLPGSARAHRHPTRAALDTLIGYGHGSGSSPPISSVYGAGFKLPDITVDDGRGYLRHLMERKPSIRVIHSIKKKGASSRFSIFTGWEGRCAPSLLGLTMKHIWKKM